MKSSTGMGGKNKGGMGAKAKSGMSSKGQPGFGRKTTGFSGKVGKNHKKFGKEMSPAG